jgi:hypothetical protein
MPHCICIRDDLNVPISIHIDGQECFISTRNDCWQPFPLESIKAYLKKRLNDLVVI